MAGKNVKRYKCPYCEKRVERNQLQYHIGKDHQDMIPQGYTAARVAFNYLNKKAEGHCIICGGVTDWNEDKKRYERLCNKPACKKKYVKMTEDRLKKARGVTKKEMMSDPQHQDMMLKNRSISGIYKFEDGGKVPYVGSYEKNFLEFMDQYLHVSSMDIQAPGPTIEYYFEGKKHFWITDFYYTPYNLVFDIKDGGSNPNKRQMDEYRAKQRNKEAAIIDQGEYNYLRLTDNKFDQLIEIMMDLKDNMTELDGPYYQKVSGYKPVVKINESVVNEVFCQNDPEIVTYKVLTDPNTYKNRDITKLVEYVQSLSESTREYNKSFFDTALAQTEAFYHEYSNFIKSGKCSYDVQSICELFSLKEVTLSEIQAIYTELKTLFSECTTPIVEEQLNSFDLDYLKEYVL